MAPRSTAQRTADALAALDTPQAQGWVASAAGGAAHLVPLSIAWIDERVVIAVEATSRTARNVAAQPVARIGVGPTMDVVMLDVVLERTLPARGAPPGLGDRYAELAGWDPRVAPEEYAYLVLRPERIQVWRDEEELPGRTVMRGGSWVDS